MRGLHIMILSDINEETSLLIKSLVNFNATKNVIKTLELYYNF